MKYAGFKYQFKETTFTRRYRFERYFTRGQLLKQDSFTVTINNKEYLSLEQFQQRGYGYIKFTGDNSFEVVIYKHMGNATSFTVAYKSAITESGKIKIPTK